MCKYGTTANSSVHSVICVLTDDKCGSHNSVQRSGSEWIGSEYCSLYEVTLVMTQDDRELSSR